MPKRIAPALEREVHRLAAKGHGLREIGRLLAGSKHAVTNTLGREPKPMEVTDWNPSPARLSYAEREEIRAGIERGDTFTVIAGLIGRAVSTVSRDVNVNGGRQNYQAWRAHQRAAQQARRPKIPQLLAGPLCDQVTTWLEAWWSPEEIANRLRIDFPDDPMMRVSHETIYQSLFVQGRGELRRELHRCLQSGRAQRRPRSRHSARGSIANKVMIPSGQRTLKIVLFPGIGKAIFFSAS